MYTTINIIINISQTMLPSFGGCIQASARGNVYFHHLFYKLHGPEQFFQATNVIVSLCIARNWDSLQHETQLRYVPGAVSVRNLFMGKSFSFPWTVFTNSYTKLHTHLVARSWVKTFTVNKFPPAGSSNRRVSNVINSISLFTLSGIFIDVLKL